MIRDIEDWFTAMRRFAGLVGLAIVVHDSQICAMCVCPSCTAARRELPFPIKVEI